MSRRELRAVLHVFAGTKFFAGNGDYLELHAVVGLMPSGNGPMSHFMELTAKPPAPCVFRASSHVPNPPPLRIRTGVPGPMVSVRCRTPVKGASPMFWMVIAKVHSAFSPQ